MQCGRIFRQITRLLPENSGLYQKEFDSETTREEDVRHESVVRGKVGGTSIRRQGPDW